jgi:hypothetical protein
VGIRVETSSFLGFKKMRKQKQKNKTTVLVLVFSYLKLVLFQSRHKDRQTSGTMKREKERKVALFFFKEEYKKELKGFTSFCFCFFSMFLK